MSNHYRDYRRTPTRQMITGIGTLLLFLAGLVGPAHAAERSRASVLGDPYIGCVASKTAVALRSYEHCDPDVCAKAAAETAMKACKRLWPKHGLSKTDEADLDKETCELIRLLTTGAYPRHMSHATIRKSRSALSCGDLPTPNILAAAKPSVRCTPDRVEKFSSFEGRLSA